jgi:hypothetical protein
MSGELVGRGTMAGRLLTFDRHRFRVLLARRRFGEIYSSG